MPEFQLDISGAVPEFRSLDGVTRGYIEALFFTEEEELEDDVGFADLHPESLAKIIADCAAFQAKPEWVAFLKGRDEFPEVMSADDEQAGRDLWFTRNGHGVGFWDRPTEFYGPMQSALDDVAKAMGECYVEFGDDEKVHVQ